MYARGKTLARWGAIVAVFCSLGSRMMSGQHKVDDRHRYERILCIVPITGTGTLEDPRRPQYAPAPGGRDSTVRSGILGFHFVESDDKKFALVEFVATDRRAFRAILGDANVKSFQKEKDKLSDIQAEFKRYRKDIDLDHFGVRMP